jgi:hypothetical protein
MFTHMLYVSGIVQLGWRLPMCSHTLCHIYTHKRCRWCYGSHPLTDYCSDGLVYHSPAKCLLILFYFILFYCCQLCLACYVINIFIFIFIYLYLYLFIYIYIYLFIFILLLNNEAIVLERVSFWFLTLEVGRIYISIFLTISN